MREVAVFAEDLAHEVVLTSLLKRLAEEHGLTLALRLRSVRGGHPRAIAELGQYVRDLRHGLERLPDLLLVGLDANCRGVNRRRREVEETVGDYLAFTVCAIPDPHIERWLLLDAAAFRTALGRGCAAPDQKCERGRYKRELVTAVRETGRETLLGGLEHAEALVRAMDLERVGQADPSFGRTVQELRAMFVRWSGT
jgi:hypothetical protein